MNEVPAELNKRRQERADDLLTPDAFENDTPIVMASQFQDELQRAVQNQLSFIERRTVRERDFLEL